MPKLVSKNCFNFSSSRRRKRPRTKPFKGKYGPLRELIKPHKPLHLSKISKTTYERLEEVCILNHLPKWVIVDMAVSHFLECNPELVVDYKLPEDHTERVWFNPKEAREIGINYATPPYKDQEGARKLLELLDDCTQTEP